MMFLKPFTAFSLSLSKFTTSLWRPTWHGSRSTLTLTSSPASTGSGLWETEQEGEGRGPALSLPWGQARMTCGYWELSAEPLVHNFM